MVTPPYMRHLVDEQGRDWHVYERSNSAQSSLPDRRSLVFDTEGMVRRIWHYPLAWASLSDDALLALMDEMAGQPNTPPA